MSYTGFRNEVASVLHQTNTPATILRLDYGYNKVHDRTYERFGAAGSPGDAYLYDKLRRLTNAYLGSTVPTAPGSNPYVKKLDYNYDDDGNRQSVVTTLWGLAPTSAAYTTNNLNQYTVVAGTNRTHDNNGNLTNDGTSKYVYNYKNLIVEARMASTNALYASYKYDAEGRRVEKSVVAGKFERYIRSRGREEEGSSRLRDNPGLGARYDMSQVVATFDSNGAWKQNFVWGERIDQIAVLEQADVLDYDGDANTAEITRSYYHLNALGSVMEITDANQAKVVGYRYTPYGEMTITRGGVTQSADPLGQYWGYTARFSDEETELWYYRARYYDGATGRMLQRDPAGYAAGPGLYGYVGSRPIVAVDPTGLYEFSSGVLNVGSRVQAGFKHNIRPKYWFCIQLALERAKAAFDHSEELAAANTADEALADAERTADAEEAAGATAAHVAGLVNGVAGVAVGFGAAVNNSRTAHNVTEADNASYRAVTALTAFELRLRRDMLKQMRKCMHFWSASPPPPASPPFPSGPTTPSDPTTPRGRAPEEGRARLSISERMRRVYESPK